MFQVEQMPYAYNPDDGIFVQSLGRHRWVYERGPRILILFTESGISYEKENEHAVNILFPPNVTWEKPYDSEPIEKEDAKEIKQQLRDAITALIPNAKIVFCEY